MSSNTIYQLKVSLKDAKLPIWRRLLVEPGMSLADLHKVIQTSMGWSNSHLHQFEWNRTYYAAPSMWDEGDTEDASEVALNELLTREKQKMEYLYDFGDSWQHEVLLETKLPKEAGQVYPVCVVAKGACPPEDCGGVWGYAELLKILADPKHKQHEEMLEWLGVEEWDPEEVDLEDINEALQQPDFGVFDMGSFWEEDEEDDDEDEDDEDVK